MDPRLRVLVLQHLSLTLSLSLSLLSSLCLFPFFSTKPRGTLYLPSPSLSLSVFLSPLCSWNLSHRTSLICIGPGAGRTHARMYPLNTSSHSPLLIHSTSHSFPRYPAFYLHLFLSRSRSVTGRIGRTRICIYNQTYCVLEIQRRN